MKMLGFVVFFTIFFSIYTAGNYYVFARASQALSLSGWKYAIFTGIFIFLWFSFIISRFTGYTKLFTAHHILTWIGSFWLVIVFYFFLIVLIVDLARLLNLIFHYFPDPATLDYIKLKKIAFWSSLALVGIVVLAGHINAITTRISRVEITSNKESSRSNIKIGLVTDIHLGTLVGKYRLEKLVHLFEKEKPDVILLAGDLLDEAQEPILNEDIGAPLKKLHAPLGVYAVPGNHEYIGGIHQAIRYIKSLNINVLQDSVVFPEKKITIIGRDDIQSGRFNGQFKRKSLQALINGVDTTGFVILMDHQPYNLNDAASNHIDLQVSGHTHNGQFWPFNYVTSGIFELSYGYLDKGKTHVYVSSGFGTWGPPVRVGNRPEIAIINVKFTNTLN